MERSFDMNTWIYEENEETFYLELSYPDAYFQKERFVWINPDIAYQLGINMGIGYVREGIIGMNDQEEIVLKMKNWRCA